MPRQVRSKLPPRSSLAPEFLDPHPTKTGIIDATSPAESGPILRTKKPLQIGTKLLKRLVQCRIKLGIFNARAVFISM